MNPTLSPLEIHDKKIQNQTSLENVNFRALNIPVYDARTMTANKAPGGGAFLLKPIQKGNPRISFANPTLYNNRDRTLNGKHIRSLSAFVLNKDVLPFMTFNGKEYWMFPKYIGDKIEQSPAFINIPQKNGKSYMFNINRGVNEEFDPNSPNYNEDNEEGDESQTGERTGLTEYEQAASMFFSFFATLFLVFMLILIRMRLLEAKMNKDTVNVITVLVGFLIVSLLTREILSFSNVLSTKKAQDVSLASRVARGSFTVLFGIGVLAMNKENMFNKKSKSKFVNAAALFILVCGVILLALDIYGS